MGIPPVPSIAVSVQESTSQVAIPAPAGAHAVLGVSTTGAVNVLAGYGSPISLVAALTSGPLVEAIAQDLTIAGGPVQACPITASVAGTVGSVWLAGPNSTRTSGNGAGVQPMVFYQPTSGAASTSAVTHSVGAGTGTVAVAGTPSGNYQFLVRILTTGTNTSATLQCSLDGGVSWTGSQTSAASFTAMAASTGLTLTMTGGAGAFVAGDIYSFTSVVHAPTGTGTIAVSGTPTPIPINLPQGQYIDRIGAYALIVTVATTGTAGTAAIQYSLDYGQTNNSGTLVFPAGGTLTIPGTNLTLTMTGTLTATDVYKSISVATSGAGCGTMTLSGTPLDHYSVYVAITTTGVNLAAATGQFQVSLDGGATYGAPTAIPTGGTYIVPGTGLTITFVDGIGNAASYPGFSAGDFYRFTASAPSFVVADLQAALNATIAAIQAGTLASYIHIVGSAKAGSGNTASQNTEALAAAVSALVDAAWTNNTYVNAMMQNADDADANAQAAYVSFADFRVWVSGGTTLLTSPITGRQNKRGMSHSLCSRVASVNYGIDPSEFDLGPAPNVQAILRNEFLTPNLNSYRLSTMRTWVQQTGFYFTNGLTMEPSGGSYPMIQHARVLAAAAQIAYLTALSSISKGVRVNLASAQPPLVPKAIDPRDAAVINSRLTNALNVTLGSQVTSIFAAVDQTTDLLDTNALSIVITINFFGYIKTITIYVGA